MHDSNIDVLDRESSFQNKLMEKVNRIWFERGEWKSISGEALQENVARKRSREAGESPEPLIDNESRKALAESQAVLAEKAGQLPFPDAQRLRESVVGKLNHAKSEIDVALDVINIMLLSQSKATVTKDLVLPPNALQATYVARPKSAIKHEVDATKLALGSKRKQLKDASAFLLNSASSLERLVKSEQDFWDEALEMRRKCWLIQPGNASQPQPGGSMTPGERSFYVQYGFGDVGSKFKEPTFAEMTRAYDKSTGTDQQEAVQMLIPHTTRRHVIARLVENHIAGLDLNFDYSEKQLASKATASTDVDEDYLIFPQYEVQNLSALQQQLQLAQCTVFESELFLEILSEARSSNVEAKFTEDGVLVNIDVHNDLVLELKKDSDIVKNGINATESPQASLANNRKFAPIIINISMHLLLLRRYRYNILESKRKLFPNSALPPPPGAPVTGAHVQPTPTNRFARPTGAGNTTELTSHTRARSIPLFSFLSSQCKLLALVNRVRHGISDCIAPLCGEGGLDISVHYEMVGCKPSQSSTKFDNSPQSLAINVTVTVIKGQSLRYTLRPPNSIVAQLPQTSLTLTSVQTFTELFKRQLNLLCLQLICDEANHLLQHAGFNSSHRKTIPEKQLWTVDEVEEKVNGLLWCKSSANNKNSEIWRRIVIEPQDGSMMKKDETLSTCKHFVFTALGKKDMQLERLEQTLTLGNPAGSTSIESVLEFRQRARLTLTEWITKVRNQLV
ncbi:hypothetical protein INT43_006977 [Umbelopsis isabellina]|uniref:Mediator of RNA polymerase II transcription subunit 17 n=1 Tax=Mortierella isabellina TaxID=91625 RepID=A0A8H7PXQ6_MORIS|nr:hypothetical protein INT43_006977 [Umbelopsis isabellina]